MKNTAIVIAIAILTLGFSTAFGQSSATTNGVNSLRGRGQAKGIVEVYEGKGGLAVTQKTKVNRTQGYNLGDTGTHEVGHKGKRRVGAIGEGASDVNARRQTSSNQSLMNNEAEIASVKARNRKPQQNLGDTGTHEVGHKGKRRHSSAAGASQLPGKQIQMDIELIAPVKGNGANRKQSR